jgi:hypothetical protein
MSLCPYYHVQSRQDESSIIFSHQQHGGVNMVRIPWCGHKHSPAEKQMVGSVIGVAGILRCGGDLEKCQVPKEKFADV